MKSDYFASLLKIAFADFKRNKVRTFLTSLGILIGVFSVVILIALGLGLKNYISSTFESLGTNLVIVYPGKILSESGGFSSGGGGFSGKLFGERDVTNLKKVKSAVSVVPIDEKPATVKSGIETKETNVYLTTDEVFSARNYELETGEFFTSADNQKGARVAVLGPKIADDLFDSYESAIGEFITVQSTKYKVIGVLKPKGGGFGGPDFDSVVYLPYKSAVSINPDKNFIGIYLKAGSEEDIEAVKKEAKEILLRRYKEDDFSLIEQTEILNAVNQIFSVLNTVLVAIGSISLLVGGVGIMNIMYASVTERTKEIGIRRAIGATKRDILIQFMTESIVLSLFGGIMGLALSGLVVLIVRSFFPASLNLFSVLVAIGISSAIGIFFGVFPAKKAANLSPIEAIRYE